MDCSRFSVFIYQIIYHLLWRRILKFVNASSIFLKPYGCGIRAESPGFFCHKIGCKGDVYKRQEEYLSPGNTITVKYVYDTTGEYTWNIMLPVLTVTGRSK